MSVRLNDTRKVIVRKILPAHSVALGFVTAAATALHLLLNVVVSPRVKDATSLQFNIIGTLELAFFLFIYALLIAGVVLLLRRKLFLSVCYLTACATTYASCFVAAALKDDRLTFPSGSHREIASIYHRQEANFDGNNRTPRLVFLDQQCHPPNGCECWVVIDPDRRSTVENDVGGWRRPTAAMFPSDTLPVHFAMVNIRVLDSSAYSVLGCDMYVRPWIPN
jgi:hypothetical protein